MGTMAFFGPEIRACICNRVNAKTEIVHPTSGLVGITGWMAVDRMLMVHLDFAGAKQYFDGDVGTEGPLVSNEPVWSDSGLLNPCDYRVHQRLDMFLELPDV